MSYGDNSWNEPWPEHPSITYPTWHGQSSCNVCGEVSICVDFDDGNDHTIAVCRDCIKRLDSVFDEPEDMEEWDAYLAAEKKKDEESEVRQEARKLERRNKQAAQWRRREEARKKTP